MADEFEAAESLAAIGLLLSSITRAARMLQQRLDQISVGHEEALALQEASRGLTRSIEILSASTTLINAVVRRGE
jgi:hypothetical protein